MAENLDCSDLTGTSGHPTGQRKEEMQDAQKLSSNESELVFLHHHALVCKSLGGILGSACDN